MNTVSNARELKLTGGPESGLERKLIAEYLQSKGYQLADLRNLPKEQRKALMKEACMYASVRLTNIEAKSKFIQKIKFT